MIFVILWVDKNQLTSDLSLGEFPNHSPTKLLHLIAFMYKLSFYYLWFFFSDEMVETEIKDENVNGGMNKSDNQNKMTSVKVNLHIIYI